ncbi:hypothetical protein Leryth_002284 [Lithospermum erythrorhizon]|nr:hypothetical protein Leryth_002284 [Lithospermum erythrorhizon]
MQASSQLSTDDDHQMAENHEISQQIKKFKDTQKAIFQDQDLYHKKEEGEEKEGEEFSFLCDGANTSPISAEDAFVNGQIKPIYPLFNRDLLLQESDFSEHFPINPHVKKVFVEMKSDTSASHAHDVTFGPCHEVSKTPGFSMNTYPITREMAQQPEGCKKSNSTGFSKLWRFKDFLHRSNSDGRDAFVFLNNNHQTTSSSHQTTSFVKKKEEEKVKKNGKNKTTSFSAHEVYLKIKAKENDKRKSYLPYRPEVFGFFTNVSGGMSKNVHPF